MLHFDATFGKNVANRPGIIEMASARSYNEKHQMTEGITMQEKGVSTLVSVNLIENELDK